MKSGSFRFRSQTCLALQTDVIINFCCSNRWYFVTRLCLPGLRSLSRLAVIIGTKDNARQHVANSNLCMRYIQNETANFMLTVETSITVAGECFKFLYYFHGLCKSISARRSFAEPQLCLLSKQAFPFLVHAFFPKKYGDIWSTPVHGYF